jgi:gliding motility-associated-like protein
VTFAGTANETQDVTLNVSDDSIVEADETFTVSLGNIVPVTVAASDIDDSDGATVTIQNEDSATVTIADVSVNEDTGVATMTLTLDNPVDGGFSVDVSTSDNTATIADSDYVAISSATENFTGTAGETQTVDVVIGVDTKVELDETFTAFMNNVATGTVSSANIDVDDTGTVTILNDDSATLSIDDVTLAENSGGATTSFVFTVTLTGEVDSAFQVDYATTEDTATSSSADYDNTFGTLNFAGNDGETQTITVTVNDDDVVEIDETFFVTLSNIEAGGLNITLADPTGTGTITNDDSATLTIADVAGNEDNGPITVTVTVDNEVDGGFTIDLNTADGTATTADSDYTAIAGETLTFAGTVGETQTFTLIPTVDSKVEADETVSLSMNNLVASTVSISDLDITDGATATITNDDTAAVTIEDVSGNEDDGDITFTATLDNPVDGGFTVNIDFTDDTATTADSDYTTASPVTLTFAGGMGETQTFVITPTVDSKVEADESLFIGLSGVVATIVEGADISAADGAIATILNDDNAIVTVDDVTVNEADGTATITATLDSDVDGGFTVDVSTADATATTADLDYTAANETLSFAGISGETQTFVVSITEDSKVEIDETFTVSMSNVAGTSLVSNIDVTDGATVTIANDDTAAVTIEDVSGNEDDGDLTFTATLDNAVQGGFTVDVNTIDGTATVADSDYTAVTGQILTFAGTAGETQTFIVTPTVDIKVETDETVTIGMTTVDNTPSFNDITITDTATATFTNDDSTEVTIDADIDVDEDAGDAVLTATLSNPVQGGFTLNVTTADGTAVATSDYTAFNDQANGVFTGTAGETQSILIPIIDDSQGELSETFTVTLTSVSGTTLGSFITTTDAATVTIIDNDAPVVLQVAVPADGLYGIGNTLDFTVTFTDFVTTTGTPTIPITIGTTTVNAELSAPVTGSLTAVFSYTILEGEVDVDGIEVGTDIALNGGTIIGSNSNIDAILGLNGVASTAAVNVDGIRPIPLITSTVPDPTNAAFDITITFDEPVTGFTVAGIDVGNGTPSNLVEVSPTEYTATITPAADGIVNIIITAESAFDAAGNGNVPSNEFSTEYDATRPVPTVSSTAPDPTNMIFDVTISFTEDVTGFEVTDLAVTNGSAGSFIQVSASEYMATITPASDGEVIVSVPENVSEDAATNGNVASNEFTIEYDTTPPLPPLITHISEYTCSGNTMMTGDNTLEISGTAERESTVEVFLDGISIGTTVTDADSGFFTFDYTGTTLADGTYTFTAIATDIAVNTGAVSNSFTITINTVDSDGDGNPDFCDEDDNGNGDTDTEEDCDGDGIVDSQDSDNSSCQIPIQQTNTYGFSPNGDGVNEGWVIENITAFPNNTVSLYSRSGKLVFRQQNYQNDFEGISNQISGNGLGKKLPVGPYVFLIDFGDGSPAKRGWLYVNY